MAKNSKQAINMYSPKDKRGAGRAKKKRSKSDDSKVYRGQGR
jgi:hypothetical protein